MLNNNLLLNTESQMKHFYNKHIFNRISYIIVFVLCSLVCYSQDENPENLNNAIEKLKNSYYRIIGLDNLDKIEGIYYFNVEDIGQGFIGDNSYLNRTKNYKTYIAILKSKKENIFYIFRYFESSAQFSMLTTNWFIEKSGTRYIIKCEKESDYSKYIENEVYISGFNISFKEEIRPTYPGLYLEKYTSIKKIFPTSTDNNIFKTGTGFFISKDGFIITNYHVIQNSSNVFVSNPQLKRVKAQIVATDEDNDIALLKIVANQSTIPYDITPSSVDIGSSVFTLGYPLIQSMGQEVKLTSGIINSNSGFENDSRYYQFSAEIQPGNSGGPLFDSDGRIVGLVSAKHTQATNAGYALKSMDLYIFIKTFLPSALPNNSNSLKGLSLSSKYKIIKDFIVLLEIE